MPAFPYPPVLVLSLWPPAHLPPQARQASPSCGTYYKGSAYCLRTQVLPSSTQPGRLAAPSIPWPVPKPNPPREDYQ